MDNSGGMLNSKPILVVGADNEVIQKALKEARSKENPDETILCTVDGKESIELTIPDVEKWLALHEKLASAKKNRGWNARFVHHHGKGSKTDNHIAKNELAKRKSRKKMQKVSRAKNR